MPPQKPKPRHKRSYAAAQDGACVLCGGGIVDPTWDHVIPKSRGGAVTASCNVAIACSSCNARRGNAPLTDEQLQRVRAAHARLRVACSGQHRGKCALPPAPPPPQPAPGSLSDRIAKHNRTVEDARAKARARWRDWYGADVTGMVEREK